VTHSFSILSRWSQPHLHSIAAAAASPLHLLRRKRCSVEARRRSGQSPPSSPSTRSSASRTLPRSAPKFFKNYFDIVRRNNEHLHDFLCSVQGLHAVLINTTCGHALEAVRKLGVLVMEFYPSDVGALAMTLQVPLLVAGNSFGTRCSWRSWASAWRWRDGWKSLSWPTRWRRR
ncbi:Os10g0116400, partial [Oryza sativa Japonica Group]